MSNFHSIRQFIVIPLCQLRLLLDPIRVGLNLFLDYPMVALGLDTVLILISLSALWCEIGALDIDFSLFT